MILGYVQKCVPGCPGSGGLSVPSTSVLRLLSKAGGLVTPLLVRVIHTLVDLGLIQEETMEVGGVTRRKEGGESWGRVDSRGPMLGS